MRKVIVGAMVSNCWVGIGSLASVYNLSQNIPSYLPTE